MSSLMGQAGELSFTVQITRKETGQVDEFQLIGQITPEQVEQLLTEQKEDDGSHS